VPYTLLIEQAQNTFKKVKIKNLRENSWSKFPAQNFKTFTPLLMLIKFMDSALCIKVLDQTVFARRIINVQCRVTEDSFSGRSPVFAAWMRA
jgi:hypothetical protein